MKKKSFSGLIVFVSAIAVSLLFGCSAKLEFAGKEENYFEFLSHFEIYTEPESPTMPDIPIKPSDPDTEFFYPEIIGFSPLYYTDFDYAGSFCGNYAFAKKNGHNLAIGKNGDVKELAEDLEGVEITADKYVFSDNGRKGVKTIFGEISIAAEYSDIQIIGNTVAAMREDETTDIFSGDEKIGFYDGKVELYSEDFLFADYTLYKTDMSVLYCGDYKMVFPPENGVGIIEGGDFYGYGNIFGETLIEPKYKFVSDFRNGYAAVVLNDGRSRIIDASDGEVISSNGADIRFLSFDGTYLLYLQDGQIHIADRNCKDLTECVFENVSDGKVHNGFIITDNGTRVYSLTADDFVSEIFVSVAEKDGFFIARNKDGKTTVYNDKFEPVSDEFDLVCYENGVMTVKSDEKYYFYTVG